MADEHTPVAESDSTLTSEGETGVGGTQSTQSTQQGTQQPLSVDKVLETLNAALVELHETGDYITYATLLDIHVQDRQHEWDPEQRTALMEGLHVILKAHPDVVYEIGWDLPVLLLDYLMCDWKVKPGLMNNVGIMAIIKMFELLSLCGNAKELFLRVNEVLNALDFSAYDFPATDDYYGAEFYERMAIHSLVELLSASLSRIRTRYPSRFLSTAIVTLVNFANRVSEKVYHSRLMIIRRYYVFLRQYSGLPLPQDADPDATAAELAALAADEDYLQRRLLTSFLTHFVAIDRYFPNMNWTYDFYSDRIHHPDSKFRLPGAVAAPDDPDASGRTVDPDENHDAMLLRYVQMAQSMDMDLEALFAAQLAATDSLFAGFGGATAAAADGKSMDELNDEVYTAVINDFNAKRRPHGTIPLSDLGLLLLVTHLVQRDKTYLTGRRKIPIRFESAIKLALRVLIPALVDPSNRHATATDAVLFWCWYAIKNDTDLQTSLPQVPRVLVNIFLQIWISLASQNPNPAIRMITNTLITRVLTLADEQLSYDFIVESLNTCPYENAQAALVGILKDLLIRPRTIGHLVDGLKNLQVSDDAVRDDAKTAAPALPPREIATYIRLTDPRRAELLKTFHKLLEEFFASPERTKAKLSIVLSFLNLFIAVKKSMAAEEIAKIVAEVDEKVAAYEKGLGDKRDEFNVTFLSVATETLKK